MKDFFCLLLVSFISVTAFSQGIASKQRPIYDNTTIGEIRLDFPNKNWSDALDSMRLYGKELLEAKVTIDGTVYETGGVRFRGNSSYQLGFKRNPMHIKFNMKDKEATYQGYGALKLSSALRDPSMIREALFSEIAGKYIAAPRYSYVKLYVNGVYNGIYVNVESVDKKFLTDFYGGSDNALFKAGVDYPVDKVDKSCKTGIFANLEYEKSINCYYNNYENDNDTNWEELQNLTKTLETDPKNIGNVLDVDNVLWNLALNNVMVNLSSYLGKNSQNFYLYKDDKGLFQMIPWDLNLAFGSFKNIGEGSDLSLKDLQRLDPLLHADNPYKPLVSKLLADPLNRKMYLAHVRQIFMDNFKNGWYEKRARELQGMVVIPFAEDPNKTYNLDEYQSSLNSTVGKRSQIPGIIELMSKRVRYLQNQAELTALPSVVSNVQLKERGKFSKDAVDGFHLEATADRFPKRMIIFFRHDKTMRWTQAEMAEVPVKGLASGEKHFEVSLKTPSDVRTIEYYILAENAGAVSFSPDNYTKVPMTASLDDLNK